MLPCSTAYPAEAGILKQNGLVPVGSLSIVVYSSVQRRPIQSSGTPGVPLACRGTISTVGALDVQMRWKVVISPSAESRLAVKPSYC